MQQDRFLLLHHCKPKSLQLSIHHFQMLKWTDQIAWSQADLFGVKIWFWKVWKRAIFQIIIQKKFSSTVSTWWRKVRQMSNYSNWRLSVKSWGTYFCIFIILPICTNYLLTSAWVTYSLLPISKCSFLDETPWLPSILCCNVTNCNHSLILEIQITRNEFWEWRTHGLFWTWL